MSLDSLLQASLPTVLTTDKPVGPTLFIGLGGTGKEVLLRLRRKIVEGYGALDRLPFLRFMHLDTDKNQTAYEQYELRAADDPLYERVRFSSSERVDLTVAGGTGRYVEHLEHFPNVKRWFPAGGKIAHLGDLKEGAGQVRIASRLGFFDASNHQKITGRLEQCHRELTNAAVLTQSSRLGFQFEPRNEKVVIIASLAGGTGSGTFLDMGFLARRYFRDAERVGILLLPAFFAGYAGADRVRANGYAALMELNHYTFGHPFIADWTTHQTERMGPPPFSSTYLLDGYNEAGLAIGSSGKELDAYRMVSEVLYQDYSVGSFAAMKRATRVNLEQFNLNVYTHNFLNDALRGRDASHKAIVGDTFPCRFGSFGLATISFPTERVQNACASRLAAKVLDYWQKKPSDDPLEHLFTKFLAEESVQCAQGRYERRDGGGVIDRIDIEDALSVFDEGGGRTFENYLLQKAQALRVELQAAPNGEKAALFASRRAELDDFFAHEDSDNPDEWGVGIRRIETNMRTYLGRVKPAIEAKAAELSDDAHYGINYALSVLQELKVLLRKENYRYMKYFDDQVPAWRDRVQYYADALNQLHLDVVRHERETLFRAADLNRDYEKLVDVRHDDDDRGAFFEHFRARAGKQVAKRGREICNELDRFLGDDRAGGEGLLGRYHDLLAGFERVQKQLKKKETYFATPEVSELTMSLLREGDIDDWYAIWIGDQAAETQALRKIGSDILTEVFSVNRLLDALKKIQRTPAETIEEAVLGKCRDAIVRKERQPDALTMLFDEDRVSSRERDDMIAQAYRLSKVWVAPSDHGLEHTGMEPVKKQQRQCLIGVYEADNVQHAQDFQSAVNRMYTGGDADLKFENIGRQHRGMIVFYQELAGVPAFYPRSVTAPLGLLAAYAAFPEKEELHTDKNRFQFGDLIPKQPAEARQYAESLQAFVLARLLGLLNVQPMSSDGDQRSFRFGYTYMNGLSVEEVNLGGEAHAVDFLYRDARSEHLTHRRYLLEKIEKTIQMLRDQKKLAVYRLLLDFYMKKVYPPSGLTGSGIPDLTITQYLPEYAVLHQAGERLNQIVATKEEKEQFLHHFRTIAGAELETELSYQQYRDALLPFCRTAGQFADRSENAVVYEAVEWRDIFALEASRIDKRASKEPVVMPPRPASPVVPVDKRFGERPCPNCGAGVDRRAVHCTQCKKTFATHVPCPHCREPRVPDDLDLCWKCGQRMREGEQLDCPQCFTFTGYEDEYPCPNCSYDPRLGPPVPAVGTPILTVVAHDVATSGNGGGNMSASDVVTLAEPMPDVVKTVVPCPICSAKVIPGERCMDCGTLMDAR
ncbi:MAG TPA: tubulin-like doman-containing protein [Thermoanaerobaculia bacterium]|jgi:hypothetical protein|nr:tubulin-like doman-containing protein [Thermoanaerobaculia bacterium]